MPPRTPFVHKLLENLDRIDRKAVEAHLLSLAAKHRLYGDALEQVSEGVLILEGTAPIFINESARQCLGLASSIKELPALESLITDTGLREWVLKNLKGLREKIVADLDILSPREMSLRTVLAPLASDAKPLTLVLLIKNPLEMSHRLNEEKLARIESLLRLAAGVAHEIGNPLNSIAIHLALLKKQLKDFPEATRKKFEKTLQVVHSETERLDTIVRNFLKATRRPPLRFQADDLNTILKEAVTFMEPEMKQARVAVRSKWETSLPHFLMDRARIYQAAINLIKNAREAMPKGGRLEITTACKEKVAEVRFKDEGEGIPEADLAHIFEPYYTTKAEGSGLGLTLVYDTVREHGGRIEVASRPGKGTTFTLLLPIRQPKLQLPQYKVK